jgi:Putative lumazine-binding
MNSVDATHPALVPLNLYIKGHQTGDGEVMRHAFLPTAHVEGIREGAFASWTMPEYVALFTGKPAPDEAQRVRTIDSVDVHGTVAMARMTLRHGAVTFTDMFVLLEHDGEWKIANKAYHMESPATG